MTDESVTQDTDTLTKPAAQLRPGVDRIAAGFLPLGLPADVLFVYPYTGRIRQDGWVFVVYLDGQFGPEAEPFRADAVIPVEAVDDGMGYSREPDDPTPVSPARGLLSSGSVIEGDHLVIDRPGA